MQSYMFELSPKAMAVHKVGLLGLPLRSVGSRGNSDFRFHRDATASSTESGSNSESSSTRARGNQQGRQSPRNTAKERAGREWEEMQRPDRHRGAELASNLAQENENNEANQSMAETTVARPDVEEPGSSLDSGTGQNEGQLQAFLTKAGILEDGHAFVIAQEKSSSRSISSRSLPRREKRESRVTGRSRSRVRRAGRSNTSIRSDSHTSYRQGGEEASPKSSGLITFPFFTWRVRRGTGTAAETSNIETQNETVLQILAKINDSIMSDESSYRTPYENAYRCTAEELALRHPDLTAKVALSGELGGDKIDLSVSLEDERQTSSGNKGDQQEKHIASEIETHEARVDNPLQSEMNLDDSERPRSRHSLERPNPEVLLNKQLFEVSQTIFWCFFPQQGRPSCPDYYHPMCERFWGALDNIFRVSLRDRDNLQVYILILMI